MMRVLVAGGRGFLGRFVVEDLRGKGFGVDVLSRQPGVGIGWDQLDGYHADAVINLCGANLASVGLGGHPRSRWTHVARLGLDGACTVAYHQWLGWQGSPWLASRVKPQERLVAWCLMRRVPLIHASGCAYYHGHRLATEATDALAKTPLSQLTVAWEASAKPLVAAGIPVVALRLGAVVGAGGLLHAWLPWAALGRALCLGSGEQHVPWVAMADVLGVVRESLKDPERYSGGLNVVAPEFLSQRAWALRVALALRGQADARVLTLPESWIRRLYTHETAELFLQGCQVIPKRLDDLGYRFVQPSLIQAVTEVVREHYPFWRP